MWEIMADYDCSSTSLKYGRTSFNRPVGSSFRQVRPGGVVNGRMMLRK